MIDALLMGRIVGAPVERTARNDSPFITCKLRVAMADGEAAFVSVIAFSTSVITALAVLTDGDAAALSGELTAGTWTDNSGNTRVQLKLTAHTIATEYHVQRKRKAVAAARAEPTPGATTTPGAEPFIDDDWPPPEVA